MSRDRFEATFVVEVDRATAWQRLTERPLAAAGGHARFWLPGFDGAVTVSELDDRLELRATKDEKPCGGTSIVVTMADADEGTRVTAGQSDFGDWLPPIYEIIAVGWRHIVADLQVFLATGVHAHRHLRAWGDLGAEVTPDAGGLRVRRVQDRGLAARLGLLDGDLLVLLGGAPVSNHDDLATVLRVLAARPDGTVSAEWVRAGELMSATVPAA